MAFFWPPRWLAISTWRICSSSAQRKQPLGFSFRMKKVDWFEKEPQATLCEKSSLTLSAWGCKTFVYFLRWGPFWRFVCYCAGGNLCKLRPLIWSWRGYLKGQPWRSEWTVPWCSDGWWSVQLMQRMGAFLNFPKRWTHRFLSRN